MRSFPSSTKPPPSEGGILGPGHYLRRDPRLAGGKDSALAPVLAEADLYRLSSVGWHVCASTSGIRWSAARHRTRCGRAAVFDVPDRLLRGGGTDRVLGTAHAGHVLRPALVKPTMKAPRTPMPVAAATSMLRSARQRSRWPNCGQVTVRPGHAGAHRQVETQSYADLLNHRARPARGRRLAGLRQRTCAPSATASTQDTTTTAARNTSARQGWSPIAEGDLSDLPPQPLRPAGATAGELVVALRHQDLSCLPFVAHRPVPCSQC